MAYPQSVSGPDLGDLDDGVQDEARGVGGGAAYLKLLGEELYHLRQEGRGGREERSDIRITVYRLPFLPFLRIPVPARLVIILIINHH